MAKKKAMEPTPASKNRESTPRQSEPRDQRAVQDYASSDGRSQNQSHGYGSQEVDGFEKDLEQDNFEKDPEQDGFQNDLEQDGFENDTEEDGFENDLAHHDTSQGSNNLDKASKRGRTKFSKLETLFGDRLVVKFNEKGQPIGPNSATYSSYLGGMARTRVPISVKTWHQIPAEVKDKYWIEIKKKFIVPEYAKKLTLKLIGKNWRGHKTQLRKKYYDAYDNDKDRIAARPEGTRLIQWKRFIALTSKPSFKKLREKGKEAVKHNTLPHTCSRKGYARLEDEMKRNNSSGVPITRASVWIQAHKKPNGEPVNELAKDTIEKIVEKNTSIAYGKDDALAQVFGGEPDGRVRGVGYGMTKSTMYGVQQCMGVVSQMQGEYKLVLEELHTLRELVVQNGNNKANHILPPQRQADMNTEGKDSFDEETSEHMNMGTSSSSQLFSKDLQSQKSFPKKTKSKRNSVCISKVHQFLFIFAVLSFCIMLFPGTTMSPQVQMDMNTHRQDDLDAEISEHVKDLPQQSGLKKKKFKNKSKKNSERVSSQVVHCKLFRMIPEDVVAEGYWYTDDPKISLHNVPLGLGYSKVSIEVAVKEDALLVRSNEEFKTIGDAVGSFVAWPTSSIIKE